MPERPPAIVGITGGIGSGKSRVCAHLAELCNVPAISLDRICRQLLVPQAAGWLALQQLLPGDFFAQSGEIDRSKLRQAIFADACLRHQIDSLIHPLAHQEMTAQAARSAAPFALAEIPLLFEAGWHNSVQLIVVVYADAATLMRRIMARDHVTAEQARQAIAAQMPLEEKARLADQLIDNGGSWESTCSQLHRLAALLCGPEKFLSNFLTERGAHFKLI